jgi:hypothetical protein
MLANEREGLRQRLVGETPAWYNPYVHLAVPSLFGLGIILLCIYIIEGLRPLELGLIPATYLVSNGVEWLTHRNMMHRKTWIGSVLYERHTPMHHRIYVTEDMAMREPREFRQVLIPAYGIMLLFLITLPVTLLLWRTLGPNSASLFVATTMAYVVGYEWLHLSYHLPQGHPIARLKWIKIFSRHHAIHHDPKLMQEWNLNVTVPIWDLILGTFKSRPI